MRLRAEFMGHGSLVSAGSVPEPPHRRFAATAGEESDMLTAGAIRSLTANGCGKTQRGATTFARGLSNKISLAGIKCSEYSCGMVGRDIFICNVWGFRLDSAVAQGGGLAVFDRRSKDAVGIKNGSVRGEHETLS